MFDTILGDDRPAIDNHRPWPRFEVDPAAWRRAAEGLRDGAVVLVGYWGEPDRVHLALALPTYAAGCVLTLACPDGGSRRSPLSIRRRHAWSDPFATCGG